MEDQEFGQMMIREHLLEGFRAFGIEGTEQVIKENFNEMPELQSKMLAEYKKILVEYMGR
jgi:hypothetical protein